MTVLAAPRDLAPFRHEAMLYADDDDYVAGTVLFVEEGLAAAEPVLVAVPEERLDLLRTSLPTGNPLLQMADMEAVGRNPARIIPAWADFARPLLATGRTVRGIGEPVWPGRSDEELTECAWHEVLINSAFADAAGFTLLCPYDCYLLDRTVIDRALDAHPHVGPPSGIVPNESFRNEDRTCPASPLPPVPAGVEWVRFDHEDLVEIRRRVRAAATAAAFRPSTVDDLVLAVNEAVVNTVLHAGGEGQVASWTEELAFVCEVRDAGRISDPLAGRRRPASDQLGGRGLWLMTQVCDLVQIRRRFHGQAIRIRISDPR